MPSVYSDHVLMPKGGAPLRGEPASALRYSAAWSPMPGGYGGGHAKRVQESGKRLAGPHRLQRAIETAYVHVELAIGELVAETVREMAGQRRLADTDP